jgi:predicted nucleic acid-binding protein
VRVRLETEAKLEIQRRVLQGKVELAWSYILDYENAANPFMERRLTIQKWKSHARVDVGETTAILAKAEELAIQTLRPKDALHLSCAIAAGCQYFLTTDDELTAKCYSMREINVLNPLEFIARTAA